MPVTKVKPGGGWSDDQPAEEIGAEFITRAQDVRSLNGSISRAQPFAPILGTPLFAPRFLVPNNTSANAFWVYAGDLGIGVTDGFLHKDITWAAFTDHTAFEDVYTGGIINQLPVVNSSVDGPFYWTQDFGTPALMVALPDWPVGDRAIAMRPFREFLIGMGITAGGTQFPDLLRWSDAAPPGDVPQSWTAGVGSQAGEVSVSFNPGALVDGAQLLDRFYVYKTNSTYVMTLVGGVFVFNQRPIFATVGALASGCVAEYRGQHIVLTDGDLVTHDGVNVTSIANNRLRNEIFQMLDGEHFENTYIALSTALKTLFICRPKLGETFPSEAITLNLDDLSFGHQSLVPTGVPHLIDGLVNTDDSLERNWSDKTTTWATDQTRWSEAQFSRIENQVVMADHASTFKLQQLGLGSDHDGVPITAVAERTGITMGDAKRRKFVRRVWPSFYGSPGQAVTIEIGVSDVADIAPAYGPAQTFIIGTDRFVNFDGSGFYLAYRITTVGGLFWQLPGFDLEFELMGEH